MIDSKYQLGMRKWEKLISLSPINKSVFSSKFKVMFSEPGDRVPATQYKVLILLLRRQFEVTKVCWFLSGADICIRVV